MSGELRGGVEIAVVGTASLGQDLDLGLCLCSQALRPIPYACFSTVVTDGLVLDPPLVDRYAVERTPSLAGTLE